MKSSQSSWRLLHSSKLTVKISSIFMAFLENMNFRQKKIEFVRSFFGRIVCLKKHYDFVWPLVYVATLKFLPSCKLTYAAGE